MKINVFNQFVLCFLCLLSFSLSLPAQCVNFTLDTQSDIDNFPTDCSEISGHMVINIGADITNLNGLGNLTSIGGDLEIYAQNISDLSGLYNLNDIGGTLKLIEMQSLTSLSGLDNLFSLGALEISNNPGLIDLTGLESLDQVAGEVRISNNDNLFFLEGLGNLTFAGAMSIESNTSLATIEGLNALTEITAGDLIIQFNHELATLNGLSNVQTVAGDVLIVDNDYLPSLDGLSSLFMIQGSLQVSENDNLLSLTGVQTLNSLGGLSISENPDLSICNFLPICDFIGQSSDVFFSNNAPGCETAIEVLNLCDQEDACPTNITLKTQSQIDQFSAIFPDCSTIEGDLYLDFTNTSPNIYPPANNLVGLAQVNYIDGDFAINGLLGNSELMHFQGMTNLFRVGGDFRIHALPSLMSFNGLVFLDSIIGNLEIEVNAGLTSMEGLDAIRYIGGNVVVNGNESMVDLEGLSQLQSIQGSLLISDNPTLSNLSGPENLAFIGNDISITVNDQLSSLTGLDAIDSIGDGVYIVNNAMLSYCAIWPLCEYLANGEQTIIEDNAAGCNNEEEVIAACEAAFDQIQGKVFADFNCNEILDSNEVISQNQLILDLSNDNLPLAITDTAGVFNRIIRPNATTTFAAKAPAGYSLFPEFRSITTSSDPQQFLAQDFALCPDSSFHNLEVDLTGYTPPRPGFSHQYQICINNIGTFAFEEASLVFNFPEAANADFISFTDLGGGTLMGDSIAWEIDSLALFQAQCFNITVLLTADTPLGTILTPQAVVSAATSITEVNYTDNTSSFRQEVVGSYDPNDKTVDIEAIDILSVSEGTELTYLIRFQNTGTFPATFVEVLDTIQENLDLSSFQMIAASHVYTLSFSEDRVLKWRFDDINLPDSTANEPESHGFIKFSIKTIPNLSLLDQIENRVAIFFDFNAPVITNTATTNIVALTHVSTLESKSSFSIYPNPSTGNISILSHASMASAGQIEVLDTAGKVLFSKNIKGGIERETIVSINLAPYPKGIYFVRWTGGGKSEVQKIVLY